jgi:antitoxin component HigA of HigAB toxin-antitoxin module
MAGEVKPIRTERDYEAALKEVERLGARHKEAAGSSLS